MIGRRCKHCEVFSRAILIGRGLDRACIIHASQSYQETNPSPHSPISLCSFEGAKPILILYLGFSIWLESFNNRKSQIKNRKPFSGDHSGGETLVPIPNTTVKPSCAYGTARATGWESGSSPGFLYKGIGERRWLTPNRDLSSIP